MLVQDNFGYVHDVAEPQLYEPHSMVYDGLGNPVGQLGDLWDVVKSIAAPITAPIQAIGQAASHLLPAVGQAVGQALPAVGNLLTAPGQIVGGLMSNLLPHPAMPGPSPVPMPMPGMAPPPAPSPLPWFRPPFMLPPGMPQMPMPQRHPMPLGWIRSTLPYTGLGPQRLYMRCAVWPGPAGMVPGPTMPTGPWPGAAGGAGAPGLPGGFPGGAFRHHRRHSRGRRR